MPRTNQRLPTLATLRRSLAQHPSKESYRYGGDPDKCPIGRHCRELGTSYEALMPKMGPTFNLWNGEITSPRPHTFGAAAERARAYEE